MKKIILALVVFVAVYALLPYSFAQEAAEKLPNEDMFKLIFATIHSIPKVGPILDYAMRAVMIIGGLMTALSVFVASVLKITAGIAAMAKASKFAQKLLDFNDKVQPYIKYASIFNVQKK